MPDSCSSPSALSNDGQPANSSESRCSALPEFPPSEKNGVNLDTLGAVVDKPGDYPGYKKTAYGYIQTDPTQAGPDFLLLVEDPNKMTYEQKHYYRNVELANLIRDDKIPTHLDKYMESDAASYKLLPEKQSIYHMNGENGAYNVKLVNDKKLHGYGRGELETVYSTVDGKLDLSTQNMPTLNRAGPDQTIGHFVKDVDPYWALGNTPHDPTSPYRRVRGPSYDQSDPEKKAAYKAIRKKLGE